MRVIDAFPTFLIYCRTERANSAESLVKTQGVFSKWLLPHLGSLELTEITPKKMLEFREAMARDHIGTSRQYGVLVVLKLFLKFCRAVLQEQALDPGLITLPRRPRPQVSYLTNNEIALIRKNIDTYPMSGLRLRALFEVLLSSGMRISEALSLNRDSIHPKTREAEIVGKGNKKRTVFLSETAVNKVEQYLGRRTDRNAALFVTTGALPRRLQRGDIPRYFKTIEKECGLGKRLTPHILRHTFCTNLRDNGADITLIKELAGHEDIQTTARYYLGSNKAGLREVVKRFQNFDVEEAAA